MLKSLAAVLFAALVPTAAAAAPAKIKHVFVIVL